jgi:membrane peptidoglycan carboxypeptidase
VGAKSATRTAVKVKSTKKRRKNPLVRALKRLFAVLFLVVLMATSAFGIVFMLALKNAREKLEALPVVLDNIITQPTRILAADGKTVLYEATEEFRIEIKDLDEVPPLVINATLAAEDKRFFDHYGVDYIAVARSIVTNVKEGRKAQGGSTITMQLAKRLFTSPEKDWQRKLDDACIAIEMERRIPKREILRHYLNQVFYGHGAYGIQAAAQVYFGKKLDDLSIAEAAMLVRIVRRPSDENPYNDLTKAVSNRNDVLAIMRDEGMITEEEYREARNEEPELMPRRFGSGGRLHRGEYFVRYVQDVLKQEFPNIDFEAGGYTIHTTLDPHLQQVSDREVKNLVQKFRRNNVTTAAFVLMDNEGRILAMTGGVDFKRNQFNAVVQGTGRQPGSAFKPFIYAAALSTGAIAPGDYISNSRFELKQPDGKVWAPRNAGGGWGGSFSLRSAIAHSKNVPAVWVIDKVTPHMAAAYARDVFGFRTEMRPVHSLALGTSEVYPLEMAMAYSVFMNKGDRVTPFGITRIVGPDKTVLKNYGPNVRRNMLDPAVASLMDGYLRAVVTEGTARTASAVQDARGKTGTTQEHKDVWFCGYTNNLVGIGWVANERFDEKQKRWVYEKMPGAFGGTVTVQLWTAVMKEAQKAKGRGVAKEVAPLERAIVVDAGGVRAEPGDSVRTTRPSGDVLSAPSDDISPAETTPPAVEPPPTPVAERTPPRTPPRDERTAPAGSTASARRETGTMVEICADTGQRATIYCPETIPRRFSAGDEPRRWCRRHTP